MSAIPEDETLAYHAARLLLVIALCGGADPQGEDRLPGIKGRTLLAKYDFFVRYPAYLQRAVSILRRQFSASDLGLRTEADADTVESRMVRFRYGPWDHVYYTALAYLIGKSLVAVEITGNAERFSLTPASLDTVQTLLADSAYTDLVQRARTVHKLFGRYTGTRLKNFIYEHFPEIVRRKLGETI